MWYANRKTLPEVVYVSASTGYSDACSILVLFKVQNFTIYNNKKCKLRSIPHYAYYLINSVAEKRRAKFSPKIHTERALLTQQFQLQLIGLINSNQILNVEENILFAWSFRRKFPIFDIPYTDLFPNFIPTKASSVDSGDELIDLLKL